ncbi:MAG: hypothetical protein Q3997_06285 [Propionibacteriaceae bacterium]|nr:hypothetical protein [Propionibacteriaceae bacterium]
MTSSNLTIAEATPEGWTAVTDDGVRVFLPRSATALRLRPGQRVVASADLSRAWIGVASPRPAEETPDRC